MRVKKLKGFVFSIVLSMLVVFNVQAQDLFQGVTAALEQINAREFSKNFDKRLLVNLDGNSNQYSAAQAEIVIREFFNEIAAKEFKLMSSGVTDQGNGEFMIGKLFTGKGVYRTYVYIRRTGGLALIQEVRFEKI
jgi:hypothetical protein